MGRRGPVSKASAGQTAQNYVGAGAPPAPDSISAEAKKHYDTLAETLSGRLEPEDSPLLAICAQAMAEIAMCNQTLASEGYFMTSDKTGGDYKHPALDVRSMAHKQFKEAATQLGLSPASRFRLVGVLGNTEQPAGGPADFDAEHGGTESA